MEKIRDIEQYIDTVKNNSYFFKSYYYHSLIDLNLIKLDSILKNGILSKELIESSEAVSIYTHSSIDINSKNGDTFVSLSEYKDNCKFCAFFESFTLHTLTSLSLMINKQLEVTREGERLTYFDDELFCFKSIDKSNIEGIILPEHLSNLMIKEVNCLPNDLSCFTNYYLNHWLTCVKKYFKQEIPESYIEELKISYQQLWNIIDEYESPGKWIDSIIRVQRKEYGKDIKDVLADLLQYFWSLKYGIENPTYLDIVMELNKNNLPVYEIKEKGLKRVI